VARSVLAEKVSWPLGEEIAARNNLEDFCQLARDLVCNLSDEAIAAGKQEELKLLAVLLGGTNASLTPDVNMTMWITGGDVITTTNRHQELKKTGLLKICQKYSNITSTALLFSDSKTHNSCESSDGQIYCIYNFASPFLHCIPRPNMHDCKRLRAVCTVTGCLCLVH